MSTRERKLMLGVSSSKLGLPLTQEFKYYKRRVFRMENRHLQIENELYTMSGIFPYTHNIQEDKIVK